MHKLIKIIPLLILFVSLSACGLATQGDENCENMHPAAKAVCEKEKSESQGSEWDKMKWDQGNWS